MTTQIDIYSLIGISLVCIPLIAWIGILRAHYLTLKVGTLRVQVLTTRIALFLPTYACLLWLSLTFPSMFGIIEAPIAIAEGTVCICMYRWAVYVYVCIDGQYIYICIDR